MTAGGLALRSITESLLSGIAFFGSAGSTLKAPVTNATLSSRDMATLCGGPTTLAGALSSPMSFGGETLMSMMFTLSAAGLSGTKFMPLTSTALLSFAETPILAVALNRGSTAHGNPSFADRQLQFFITPPRSDILLQKRQDVPELRLALPTLTPKQPKCPRIRAERPPGSAGTLVRSALS